MSLRSSVKKIQLDRRNFGTTQKHQNKNIRKSSAMLILIWGLKYPKSPIKRKRNEI